MSEQVKVIVTGLTGSGKSGVYGEIFVALRAIGLTVEHVDPDSWQSECGTTGAAWQTALEMYRPTVVMEEINIPRLPAGDPA